MTFFACAVFELPVVLASDFNWSMKLLGFFTLNSCDLGWIYGHQPTISVGDGTKISCGSLSNASAHFVLIVPCMSYSLISMSRFVFL